MRGAWRQHERFLTSRPNKPQHDALGSPFLVSRSTARAKKSAHTVHQHILEEKLGDAADNVERLTHQRDDLKAQVTHARTRSR